MIKVGIIGAGRIGKVHAESIKNYVDSAVVKSIADPFMNDETTAWAKKMGIENTSKDYADILNDKEIDAVLICSPTDTHCKISIEAARAGKHIFCEKPIDSNPANINKVLDEVKAAGVKFQIGFNRRFDSNFMAVREAVESGKIGKPHVVKITSRDPAPPPIEYIKVSGGIFMDMAIHDFDMIRYLSMSEAVSVYAAGAVLVDEKIGQAGDIDTAVITVTMENGCICVIDNSRQAVYGYDQRAEVFGSLGCVSVSNNTNSTAVISTKDGVVAEKPLFFFLERYMQAYSLEIKSFADAVANGKDVPVGGNDGLAPTLIALAAKKSLDEKRLVLISEIK